MSHQWPILPVVGEQEPQSGMGGKPQYPLQLSIGEMQKNFGGFGIQEVFVLILCNYFHLHPITLVTCRFMYNRGWQNLFVKVQTVIILGFIGHTTDLLFFFFFVKTLRNILKIFLACRPQGKRPLPALALRPQFADPWSTDLANQPAMIPHLSLLYIASSCNNKIKVN